MRCKDCNYKKPLSKSTVMCPFSRDGRIYSVESTCKHFMHRLVHSKARMETKPCVACGAIPRIIIDEQNNDIRQHIDIKYVYNTLLDIAADTTSDKLMELIQYMTDFVVEATSYEDKD